MSRVRVVHAARLVLSSRLHAALSCVRGVRAVKHFREGDRHHVRETFSVRWLGMAIHKGSAATESSGVACAHA